MNQKIQELAREALFWFEHRTWYWTIKNGAPEWVQELVWVAHNEGEILPDDCRYRFIVEALGALAEGEHNLEPDVDINRLLSWLDDYPSYRMGIIDEVVSEFGWSGLFEALQAGQLKEKEEVLGIVKQFLEKEIAVKQFLENEIGED